MDGYKITLLDFLSEFISVLLKLSENRGRYVPLTAPDHVRYDSKDNNIVMGETQRVSVESPRKM